MAGQAAAGRSCRGSGLRVRVCAQVLGGTAQVGDTDLRPREEDRRHIWEGCLRMVPSLKGAPVRGSIFTRELLGGLPAQCAQPGARLGFIGQRLVQGRSGSACPRLPRCALPWIGVIIRHVRPGGAERAPAAAK